MAGKFVIKQGKNGKFLFNLLSSNGQTVLTSQMYSGRDGAVKGIESVRKNAADAGRFERREAKNGNPYFVLKAGNGLEIGRSEIYSTKASMEKGIASVSKNAPDAPIAEAAKK
ncbi:MAG: YegP family protein [Aridibacter famidurans]|nr:YegP family protein [Aridibacter famidurans]